MPAVACQVERKDGIITKVLTPNGKESNTYKSILDIVNNMLDVAPLRTQFQSWVGKHISNVDDNKEIALALYKQTYSPMFKEWFGDWTKVAKGINARQAIPKSSIYTMLFDEDPQQVMYEAAAQYLSSLSEGEGATETFGEQLTHLSVDLFPNAKQGEPYQPVVGQMDENGEPIISGELYTNVRGDKRNILSQSLGDPSYRQFSSGTTIPSAASPKTIAKVKKWLERMGVKLESLADIRIDGKRIDANGIADPLKRLIRVVHGKESVALPEEAMHIAVELIQTNDPKLFRELMSRIGEYPMYTQVVNQYGSIYRTPEGNMDVIKVKKEAVAKVLTQMMVDKDLAAQQSVTLTQRLKAFWDRIVTALKTMFNRAGVDPFEEGVKFMNRGNIRYEVSPDGTFLQSSGPTTGTKIMSMNNQVVRLANGDYEINGRKIKNSVDARVKASSEDAKIRIGVNTSSEYIQKREHLDKLSVQVHQDITSIFNDLVNDEGYLKEEPTDNGTSAVDPLLKTPFYANLRGHLEERLNAYMGDHPGTQFFNNTHVYDSINDIAGTIDLLALRDDGKVDIIQFKLPNISAKTDEASRFAQQDYNKEINELRAIVEKGYGVKTDQINLSRVIPIKLEFSEVSRRDPDRPGKTKIVVELKKLQIGNADATKVKDDALVPIPSTTETTGNKKLDKLLASLRGLLDKIGKTKVPDDQTEEKRITVNRLFKGIKKLQVQRNANSVLEAGKILTSREQVRFSKMRDIVDAIDTSNHNQAIIELNDVSKALLEQVDEASVFGNLGDTFNIIFGGTSDPLDRALIAQAQHIQNDVKRIQHQQEELGEYIQTTKVSEITTIRDEFKPEQPLSYIVRLYKSLSQSATTSGKMLWKLVMRQNESARILFNDKLDELEKLKDEMEPWMKANGVEGPKGLYSMFFQQVKKEDGTIGWSGNVVKQFKQEFYDDLEAAKEAGDKTWVLANVDMPAYKKWYLAKHISLKDEVMKRTYNSSDDKENANIRQQILKEFVQRFSPSSPSFVSVNNYRLKQFPNQAQESEQYKRLFDPGNEPLLKLWNYWQDTLKYSVGNGMLEDHLGYGFFPNVRKPFLEKLTTSKAGGKLKDFFFSSLITDAEDAEFGKLNPITQEPMKEVAARFVTSLGKKVEGTDDRYFGDKSQDIFKVMALWQRETVRYDLRTETEAIARLLIFTEQNRGSLMTSSKGKGLLRDKDGKPIVVDDNEVNTKYLQDHTNAAYYGQHLSNEHDVPVTIPVKGVIRFINKVAGRTIIEVPKNNPSASGIKLLSMINRFHLMKTLGLSPLTPIANVFGGFFNSYANNGRFFNKRELTEGNLQLTSSAFTSNKEDKMVAGLLSYIDPYFEDRAMEHVRGLSISNAVHYLTTDHLMVAQKGSDAWVNKTLAITMIRMALVVDGKIINAREYAKTLLDHDNKYAKGAESAKEFDVALEAKVKELIDGPLALKRVAQDVNDRVFIPGITTKPGTVDNEIIKFRGQIMELIKDALGNTSKEDLSLGKTSVIFQSFNMYKNWIPRLLIKRFGGLEYSAGTDQYEWGRARMLYNATRELGSSSVSTLLSTLAGGGTENLIKAARQSYTKQQQKMDQKGQKLNMTEAQFIDMYIKGVRSEMREVMFAMGMMGILLAAQAYHPDADKDVLTKGQYRYLLRTIDKLQDEISFFYNPHSFSDIVNGSIFPAAGLLLDIQKFFGSALMKGWAEVKGDDKLAAKQHPLKYGMRIFPITKELLNYIAIFYPDLAKSLDVKISAKNGSSR